MSCNLLRLAVRAGLYAVFFVVLVGCHSTPPPDAATAVEAARRAKESLPSGGSQSGEAQQGQGGSSLVNPTDATPTVPDPRQITGVMPAWVEHYPNVSSEKGFFTGFAYESGSSDSARRSAVNKAIADMAGQLQTSVRAEATAWEFESGDINRESLESIVEVVTDIERLSGYETEFYVVTSGARAGAYARARMQEEVWRDTRFYRIELSGIEASDQLLLENLESTIADWLGWALDGVRVASERDGDARALVVLPGEHDIDERALEVQIETLVDATGGGLRLEYYRIGPERRPRISARYIDPLQVRKLGEAHSLAEDWGQHGPSAAGLERAIELVAEGMGPLLQDLVAEGIAGAALAANLIDVPSAFSADARMRIRDYGFVFRDTRLGEPFEKPVLRMDGITNTAELGVMVAQDHGGLGLAQRVAFHILADRGAPIAGFVSYGPTQTIGLLLFPAGSRGLSFWVSKELGHMPGQVPRDIEHLSRDLAFAVDPIVVDPELRDPTIQRDWARVARVLSVTKESMGGWTTDGVYRLAIAAEGIVDGTRIGIPEELHPWWRLCETARVLTTGLQSDHASFEMENLKADLRAAGRSMESDSRTLEYVENVIFHRLGSTVEKRRAERVLLSLADNSVGQPWEAEIQSIAGFIRLDQNRMDESFDAFARAFVASEGERDELVELILTYPQAWSSYREKSSGERKFDALVEAFDLILDSRLDSMRDPLSVQEAARVVY